MGGVSQGVGWVGAAGAGVAGGGIYRLALLTTVVALYCGIQAFTSTNKQHNDIQGTSSSASLSQSLPVRAAAESPAVAESPAGSLAASAASLASPKVCAVTLDPSIESRFSFPSVSSYG